MASLYPNGIKGLSDSKWSGVPGSASRLVGIDLHSTPGLVKVHQKLTKNSPSSGGHQVTELCKHKVGASNGTTLWFSSESGKIWREISGTWTLAHTTIPTSGGAACLGAAEFENWIYWATENYLHRIHVDDINGTWSNHLYQNWQAFSIGDDESHPMAEQNLELFIGDKQVLAKVSDPSTAAPNPTDTLTTTLGSSALWLAFAGLLNPSEDAFPSLLASEREADANADTVPISYLVVGGGGGGGDGTENNTGGGGGGSGGVLTGSAYALTEGAYAVTVGPGGAGASTAGTSGSDGSSSSVAALFVTNGGGGGGGGTPKNGRDGGSGGGGTNVTGVGGSGTPGQGNAGGSATNIGGGGGGGAGAVGSNSSTASGAVGGAGVSSSITGSSVTYGGGGGGGGGTGGGIGGAAGSGGGGAGGDFASNGANATANTGGGGGGGGSSGNGGNGGSGTVVISYATNSNILATGGTITTSGGNTIHTFTSSGTFAIFFKASTLTKSVTVPSGHKRLLLALVANYTSEIPASAAFNGQAMTAVTGGGTISSGGTTISHRVFRYLDPPATTANVVVTWGNATTHRLVHIAVFDLVDQGTPTAGFDAENSTSTSAAITLDSDESYQTRIGVVVSNAATHTVAAGQSAIESGTNTQGNDSSSYIGTTASYGFTAETNFNLKAPERITALETFDIDLLVGTRWPNRSKARVLRWNTASESWSSDDTLDENGVNAFLRDDNYVYVQAGEFGRFYFYNGEQLLPYTRLPGDWSPTKTAKVNPSAVAFLLGVPVFGLSNLAGNPSLQGVYALGSYSKDYLKVLDLSFPISSGEFSGVSIGAVLVKGADLYVAWKGATSAGVDKLDYGAKYASAYVETMMLSAPQERGILKTALEACAYYASLPASTGIIFGYKKKYDTDFTTITPVTDAKLCAVKAKETIPEIANLQLRFGFTVSGNNAPEVEDFAYELSPLKT